MQKKLEAIGRLIEIMDELRVKCPWDREQTMLSLRNSTIEECFELTDSILEGDTPNIRKELGDLLLHIVFYSKIAQEQGLFDLAEVADTISDKLIYRHPHVFGDVVADTTKQVGQNWEALKQKEKDGNKTTLSGVPRGMPSLPKACRIQEKAAHTGFDWQEKEQVWDKVCEELAEVEAEMKSGDPDKLEAEFGDLLFSLVNAARLYGVNPDIALERTNKKFIQRFTYMENETIKKGISLHDLSLAEMDQYWNAAKKSEHTHSK